MAKFYINAPRYIQQKGEAWPSLVNASPDVPVLVELPDDFKPSKHDRHIKPASVKPEKLAPAHAGKKASAVRKSHEGGGKKVKAPGAKPEAGAPEGGEGGGAAAA